MSSVDLSKLGVNTTTSNPSGTVDLSKLGVIKPTTPAPVTFTGPYAPSHYSPAVSSAVDSIKTPSLLDKINTFLTPDKIAAPIASPTKPVGLNAPIITGPSLDEIKQQEKNLTDLKGKVNLYDQNAIDQYNQKVKDYSSSIDKYNAAQKAHAVLDPSKIIPVGQTIKFPFLQNGIIVPSGGAVGGAYSLAKSAIEAPEKAARSLSYLAGLDTPTEKRTGDQTFQVPSYAEVAGKTTAQILDDGLLTPVGAVIIGSALGAGDFANDALLYAGLLESGAAKAAEEAGAITSEELKTAHEFLGNPKTMEEAKANYYKIQHEFHPDITGGDDTISKQANNAYEILKKEGIPTGSNAGTVNRKPTKDSLKLLADEIGNSKPSASIPEIKTQVEEIASKFTPKAPEIEGINPRQEIKLTPEESTSLSQSAADQYYNRSLKPVINEGKAAIIGSDNIKDFFGKDYNVNNHEVYSKAANQLFEKAVGETKNPIVKFTVGGTGSGKSDFLVPEMADKFNGVVYDSTGYNYEGLKKQIEFARAHGKTPEVYSIVPDIARSRAYTFARELAGEHPVSEAAFVRTHSEAIKTLIKLIEDGIPVHVIDTRNIHSMEDVEKAEFVKDPLDLLKSLEYSEKNVKEQISGITKDNAQAFIKEGKKGIDQVPEKNGSDNLNKNELQGGEFNLREGGKGKELNSSASGGGVGSSDRGDIFQATERLSKHAGENGENSKLLARQGKELSKGNSVKITSDTFDILREAGYSESLVNNLKLVQEQGGVSNLVLTEEIKDKDFISAFSGNTLYLNPAEIDNEMYLDGSIINHELAGHSWYLKLSNESRASFYNSLKNNVDTIKEAWADSDNPYKNYWERTLNSISNQILQRSTPEITERISSDFGLTFNPEISLEQFVDQSLNIDKIITAINSELARIGRDPLTIEAHNTVAIQEHVAMLAEKSNIVRPNEDIVGNYVEDVKNGNLKYGTQATQALAYQGETDLSLKTLDKLKGRITVSKQFISDLANSGDITQPERNIIREVLEGYSDGEKIPVAQFAKDVKIELLPLSVITPRDMYTDRPSHGLYENIALPEEQRGNVANYQEHIYQSPIKTSAGNIHFPNGDGIGSNADNYFGHTRIEDMGFDNRKLDQAKTRRVIEVQSDLYQKGHLEYEGVVEIQPGAKIIWNEALHNYRIKLTDGSYQYGTKAELQAKKDIQITRPEEIKKLQQYNDPTAHFRMVREEVKKAAEDRKTKLQFPTGETAMKIEGLGQGGARFSIQIGNTYPDNGLTQDLFDSGKAKVGTEILNEQGAWIITDVLGDGKFKAVPKARYKDTTRFKVGGRYFDYSETARQYARENNIPMKDIEQDHTSSSLAEEFDISGKVDTNNPIYRFYEKDLGRYLKNKYGAERITDDKEVSWYEVNVKPEMATEPVMAFREKTQDIEQLQKMLEREQESLAIAESNPEMHAAAYGSDRIEKYKAKIVDLKDRIANAKNPTFNTGDKLQDVRLALANAENRVGVETSLNKKLNALDEVIKMAEENPQEDGNSKENLQILKEKRVEIDNKIKDFKSVEKIRKQKIKEVRNIINTGSKISNEDIKGIVNSNATKGKRRSPLQKAIQESQKISRDSLDKLLEATYGFSPVIENDRPESIGEILASHPITLEESLDLNKSTLPKMVIDTNTPVKEKVGIHDYFRTPDRVLKKIGLGSLIKPLRHAYESYLAELPAHMDLIRSWQDRATEKGASKRIFQYLDGQMNKDFFSGKKIEPLSPKELEIAQEMQTYLKDWAERLGLPEDKQLSHYITHIFDIGANEKEFDEDVAKIINKKIAGSVYDPFLLERMGKKGYIEDVFKALEAYSKRAVRKANMDPILERIKEVSKKLELSQQNYVKRLVDKINMRPNEIENLVDNFIKQTIGYKLGQRPVAVISGAMRKLVFRSALGLNIKSALKNLTQGVNTYSKLGEKYTLVGYTKLLTQGTKELEEAGVLGQDMVQDKTVSATRKIMQGTDNTLFFLFETAEKINRGSAYYGAKTKFLDDFYDALENPSKREKFTERYKDILGKYQKEKISGLFLPTGSNVAEYNAVEYGKKIVRDTQFQFGSIDMPVGMNDAITKTLFQFLSFGVKQAEFAYEMGKNKEWAGIFRYILATFALVWGVGKTLGLKWSDFIPGYSIISRLGQAPPAFALPWEITKAAMNTPDYFGNQRTLTQKGKDIAAQIPYPAKTQIEKTVKGAEAIKNREVSGAAASARALFFGVTNDNTPLVTVSKNLKTNLKTAQNKLNTYDSAEVSKVQDTYDQAKTLGFDTPEAQALVDGLSDNEYTIYQAVAKVEDSKDAINLEPKILPIVMQVHDLGTDTPEAQKLVDGLSDQEYSVYKTVYNSVFGSNNQKDTSLGTWDKQSLIDHIVNISNAIHTDPVTAFNDIFAGNSSWRITGQKNGQIMVQRMSEAQSESIKKSEGGQSKEFKLDHIVPLEVGGNNGGSNLQLIPTDQWSNNSPIENYLGTALSNSSITGSQAREYIIRYKAGQGETLSPELQKEYKDKYNSQPLTFDQIKSMINS